MRRHENLPARPTAGCLSVPLFNQKKRSRMPLTSNPSENCSNDYMTTTNSSNSASGCYQASGYPATAPQSQQWNRQGDTQYYQQPRQYGSNRPAPGPAPTTPHAFQIKPAIENSLRILTAFIDGMRHWSQFKDRAPYLFEIFATLDSAVTVGSHGAKNFLMRDGKDVMQCVFYENEKELPRLIRGQVHRCVGNYDRTRDILVCVSVRAGLPSEQRNAQETVKACDVEMRALVKSLSEI
ncbi:spermatogenesis-associated protein 22 [Polymixia lowei]